MLSPWLSLNVKNMLTYEKQTKADCYILNFPMQHKQQNVVD